jgi:hypothetical protein
MLSMQSVRVCIRIGVFFRVNISVSGNVRARVHVINVVN